MKSWLLLPALLLGCQAAPATVEGPPWHDLLADEAATSWESIPFGLHGPSSIEAGRMTLGMGGPLTGMRWSGAALPREYELELTCRKTMGTDFLCGLTFPIGESAATVILGGWGGALTGLSSIDGLDASENFTCSYRRYPPDTDFQLRVRVTTQHVRAWLDGELLFTVDTTRHRLSVRDEMEACTPLGIASYSTASEVSRMRWRGT